MGDRVAQTRAKADIRAAIDLAELVRSAGVELRQDPSTHELIGLCPFHDEKTPSFTVDPKKGVYHCFGCEAGGDVFSFVQALEGVDFPTALAKLAEHAGVDLLKTNGKVGPDNTGTRHFEHPYHDISGSVVVTVHRVEDSATGKKTRRPWRTPKGVRTDSVPIYRHPEVREADDPVVIVEGEHKADRLRDLGITATCNLGGAGKWKVHHSEQLRGRDVTVWADNDDPGDRRLVTANRQIEETTRNKSEFLRRMSHDLRSPMNAIIGYSRVVLRRSRDVLDERQVRNLENILQATLPAT